MLTASKEPTFYPKIINSKPSVPVNSRLRQARELKRYTLAKTSQELKKRGVSCAVSTLQSYEQPENSMNRRYPSLKMLVSLANLFECSTDFLLGISDEMNRYDCDLFNQMTKFKKVSWKNEVIDNHQAHMIIYKMDQIMSL
jgi:transcriptional regulator with XRE-family HTH domain